MKDNCFTELCWFLQTCLYLRVSFHLSLSFYEDVLNTVPLTSQKPSHLSQVPPTDWWRPHALLWSGLRGDHGGPRRRHSEAGGEEVGHGFLPTACWAAHLFGRCGAALSLDQSLPSPTLPQRLCSCFLSPGSMRSQLCQLWAHHRHLPESHTLPIGLQILIVPSVNLFN